MTATLTDRYIWAVQRSLPEQQRDDIDQELRASIADAVDARVDGGADAAVAERETLVELGDPYRLAAGYADRPLHLIGPALFPTYIRLLKVLYFIVLPISVGAVVLGLILSQPDSVGAVMGPAWASAISIAAHLGFWTTLVFAIIERTNSSKAVFSPWSPDDLPDVPQTAQVKLGDALGSVVFLVTMLGVLLWQQFLPPVPVEGGEALPVVNPELWSSWLPVLFGIAVLEIGFALLVYKVGRWTVPLAVLNAVLAVAAAGILVWLFLTNQVFDPRAMAALGVPSTAVWVVGTVSAWVAVGVGVWDIVDGIIKTWRHRRIRG